MKKFDVGQSIALFANIGVILSLIFVGIQIHQSASATRSATIMELKNAWVELNLANATSVDLSKAFQDVNSHGWDDSEYVSKSLVAGFYRTLLHNWSDAYFQYRNGMLDEEQWMPYLREMKKNA